LTTPISPAIYLTMNNIGKSAAAGVTLAVLLGTGWWVIDRGQGSTSGQVQTSSVSPVALGTSDTTKIASDWIDEIDASIRLLNETLLSSGNIAGSIALLDILDARIARHDAKTMLAPLRAALASDREKLAAIRSVDLAGSAALLDQMALDIDTLPLLANKQPLNKTGGSATPASNPPSVTTDSLFGLPTWQAVVDSLVARLSGFVQIRRVDNPHAMLLTPEQAALTAERLRLRLLSARMALVSRQEQVFLQDIGAAQSLLSQLMDPEDSRVIAHQQTLIRLAQQSGRIAIPAGLRASTAIDQLRQAAMPARPGP
jgi:uncharacterized protein HemX